MKVRILVSMSGADFSYMTGEIAEVSPEVGKHWVEIGYAAPVEAPPETAEAAPAPENAMAPRPGRKKTK